MSINIKRMMKIMCSSMSMKNYSNNLVKFFFIFDTSNLYSLFLLYITKK